MVTEIRVEQKSQTPLEALRDLIMAWARDKDTGEPVYIIELGTDRRGSHSRCICPSCLAPLTAVNAAKAEFIKRPHFRHPSGTEKHSCSIVAARFALLKEVQADGWIQLPQVRRKASARGLSGQTYEAWVSAPAEKVRITHVNFQDHARALLTLEDGRSLQVLLTGTAVVSPSEEIGACLTLNIDDPEADSLSPEELRKRLVLLPDMLCWQSHWADDVLNTRAQDSLERQMLEAIDAPPPDLDLSNIPAELRRETVLHYMAKQILKDVGEIRVPAISHEVTKRASTGETFTRSWSKPEATLILSNIELECRLGRVVPDIVCEAKDGYGNILPRLCIEITVTNPIDEERKARLLKEGTATLEVDLSRTGGRLTQVEFQEMLVREVDFKNWICNVEASAAFDELRRQVDADVQQHLGEIAKARKWRSEVLAMDVKDIGRLYLAAMTNYLQEQDLLDGGMPKASREAVEAARVEVMRLADMMAVHGYFGGTGASKGSAVSLLSRFLSLKHDRGIGYRMSTGFEVLNAIWQSGSGNRKDIPMYLAAARLWKITLSEKQAGTLKSWRIEVKRSIEAGEDTYLRQPSNDSLLRLLFPDLRDALAETTKNALEDRFRLKTNQPTRRDGYLSGAELERWLRDHPESAPMWQHLRK
ncbi:hypothetical protein [Rhodoferax sp. BAB1]|uniref:hypothetical protein n=1 Tax=Rhodoferax sp. BAB1 TaxID=2741720 RepID=UPI001576DFAD|nr:hypothetical protein [Rhodoferax sp. BAB1]QKO23412.1 hypothetical protein HTY51_16670 [Rhodoferax sp. BAB1]